MESIQDREEREEIKLNNEEMKKINRYAKTTLGVSLVGLVSLSASIAMSAEISGGLMLALGAGGAIGGFTLNHFLRGISKIIAQNNSELKENIRRREDKRNKEQTPEKRQQKRKDIFESQKKLAEMEKEKSALLSNPSFNSEKEMQYLDLKGIIESKKKTIDMQLQELAVGSSDRSKEASEKLKERLALQIRNHSQR